MITNFLLLLYVLLTVPQIIIIHLPSHWCLLFSCQASVVDAKTLLKRLHPLHLEQRLPYCSPRRPKITFMYDGLSKTLLFLPCPVFSVANWNKSHEDLQKFLTWTELRLNVSSQEYTHSFIFRLPAAVQKFLDLPYFNSSQARLGFFFLVSPRLASKNWIQNKRFQPQI